MTIYHATLYIMYPQINIALLVLATLGFALWIFTFHEHFRRSAEVIYFLLLALTIAQFLEGIIR